MAFEQQRAEIELLLEQTRDVPEDKHELYELVRQKFGEMRAVDRKSTRLNSSHLRLSRMPSSA